MASRTIIVSSLVGGSLLLAVMGIQVEVISAANPVQGQEVQHEEDLDPTAQEILDLAKEMDFQSMRVRARTFEPMLDDILKPGQKPMAMRSARHCSGTASWVVTGKPVRAVIFTQGRITGGGGNSTGDAGMTGSRGPLIRHAAAEQETRRMPSSPAIFPFMR